MPSIKTFINTLFVITLINERDQYHERAAELADLYDGQPLLITAGWHARNGRVRVGLGG